MRMGGQDGFQNTSLYKMQPFIQSGSQIIFLRRSVAPHCQKVVFAFEGGYVKSVVRKSMLDMPVPGSF